MMRAVAGFCAAGLTLLVCQSAVAAEQCGPLQRITSVDTVTGPAGYMLVPVKIGDAQRLLLFDTGGAVSSLTLQGAQELHLPIYDSPNMQVVTTSGAKSARVVIIP